MKNFRYILCLTVLLSLVLTSCRKDNDTITNGSTVPTSPKEIILATFDGIVIDEFGTVLENAEVNIDGEIVLTNAIGYFRVRTEANLNGTNIKVSKEGYVDAFANVVPFENEVNTFEFTLILKNLLPPVSSTSTDRISFGAGNSIQFAANSIVDQEGNNYSGNVNIYANFINATSKVFSQIVPGDMLAQRANNEEVIVKSFGVLVLEIADENGRELFLSEPAQLRIDVDPTSSVALDVVINDLIAWNQDSENVIWMEGNPILKQQSILSFDQQEMGRINLGSAVEFVTGEYALIGVDSLQHFLYRILDSNRRFVAGGDFGYNNKVIGKFPQEDGMQMELYSQCNSLIGSTDLKPLEENGMENIAADIQGISSRILSGVAIDCEFNPILNGVAILNVINAQDYQLIVPIKNGVFSFGLNQCLSNDAAFYEVMAIDFDRENESEIFFYQANDLMNFQLISTCTDPETGMWITFENGEEYYIQDIQTNLTEDNPDFFIFEVIATDTESATGEEINYIINFDDEGSYVSLQETFVVNEDNEPTFLGQYDNLYFFEIPNFVSFSYFRSDNLVYGLWENASLFEWDNLGVDGTFSIDRGIGTVRFVSPIN